MIFTKEQNPNSSFSIKSILVFQAYFATFTDRVLLSDNKYAT